MLKQIFIAAGLAGLAAVAHAASPSLPTPLPVSNDGFIYVARAGDASHELLPRFCPLDTHYSEGIVSASGCRDKADNIVPAVPAQSVLDQTFGAGKAIAAGVTPSSTVHSIVYYKIRKDMEK